MLDASISRGGACASRPTMPNIANPDDSRPMIGKRVGVIDGVGVRQGGTPGGVGLGVGVAVPGRLRPGGTAVGHVRGVGVTVGVLVTRAAVAVRVAGAGVGTVVTIGWRVGVGCGSRVGVGAP